jgi:hypothetical protein
MRAAKARGEIARFPNGGRAKGLPPLSRNPIIRKAQRLIEAKMQAKAVVVPVKDITKAEKLGAASDRSLDRVVAFLDQDIDPQADPKLFALQINTSLTIISVQGRLDAAALQAQALSTAGLSDEQKRARTRSNSFGFCRTSFAHQGRGARA